MGRRKRVGKKRLEKMRKRKRWRMVMIAESDKVMEASTEKSQKLIPQHGAKSSKIKQKK